MANPMKLSLRRQTLLAGPVTGAPSWQWCAVDLFDSLQAVFDVVTFRKPEEVAFTPHDILLLVKHPVDVALIPHSSRVAFMPVDFFESREHLAAHRGLFARCGLVLAHTTRLAGEVELLALEPQALEPYGTRVVVIDHWGKYALPTMKAFSPRKPRRAAWVGWNHYAPLVVDWYRQKSRTFALQLAVDRPVDLKDCPGLSQVTWSKAAQRELFACSEAGIDLKGDSFSQLMKPPTKIQQFVASGIPTAANASSYAREYFSARGLNLAGPDDEERWFSPEYWEETRMAGVALRKELSLAKVAGDYVRYLTELGS